VPGPVSGNYLIRRAVLSDAEGIAKVHVSSWQTSYREILDKAYLNSLSVDEWKKRSIRRLENEYVDTAVAVRQSDNEIVGFVSVGASQEKNLMDVEGEIYALYLLESEQGKGLGRKLFDFGVHDLKSKKFKTLFVSVLQGNPSAQFYENMGGKLIGTDRFELLGKVYPTATYFWPEI
jgi:ribosomal protein S18 acetylase RimI-like enzyme